MPFVLAPPLICKQEKLKMEPQNLQLIGVELAVLWKDGVEDYLPMEFLRAASPSADNMGEPDIFGRMQGGDPQKHFPGVRVVDFVPVGRYGVRLIFSDGHQTGIFSFPYLRRLGEYIRSAEAAADDN